MLPVFEVTSVDMIVNRSGVLIKKKNSQVIYIFLFNQLRDDVKGIVTSVLVSVCFRANLGICYK